MADEINVFIIGTVGVPAKYGGFETLVENLSGFDWAKHQIDITVSCEGSAYTDREIVYKNIKRKFFPLKANGIQSVLHDGLAMLYAFYARADVVLVLGVSGGIWLPFFRVFCSNTKVIVNIDGLEWRRKKWGLPARIFLKFSEWIFVKSADVIITDNPVLGKYVEERYSKNSVTIAYGGDHALNCTAEPILPEVKSFYLSICRIEPENNVKMICETFSKLADRNLVFVGNFSETSYGKQLREEFKEYENIYLLDPIYDLNKLKYLRSQCVGYIHGHSAGGTNPSLVEAMFFGKTTFCYDCDFNRATTDDKAYYFLDHEDLRDKIVNVSTGDDVVLREIAQKKFSWHTVIKMYQNLFVSCETK